MELLQTKLQRPRVSRSFMPRPRLLERLDQGSQRPLTLVCAGAGYGKTMLVSSWMESIAAGNDSTARQPAAWISLDERDSDLDLFLRYFIAGLRTIFPYACDATSGLLQATRKPPFDLLCATLINEIAGLPHDFILALDDYHLIGDAAVPDLLNELLLHWPLPMHLVLITRHTPAMALASLRAKGQLTEIRARDLRFTLEEAGVYLGQALERPLNKSAIEFLEQRTEGWIAGLQLASLSLQDAEDPESLLQRLSGLDVEFADYLTHDVLSRQPAAIHQFLLQTAILDHFSVELCEAMISNEVPEWSARRCIEWLERHNLFVISLDSRNEWYRYHQLFRDLLLQRAKAGFVPSHAADLQRRAAVWFADHGQVDEAVRHALAAGDRELTARFVAQGLCDVLNREDRPALERWLGLFEEEYIQSRLELLIVRGFSLFLSWQLGALAKMLPRAAALLGGETHQTLPGGDLRALRGCLAALSAAVAYFSNDPVGAVAHSREVLALLPEAWVFARSGGLLFQTLAMQANGQGQAAVKLLIENYESLGDRASAYARRLLLDLCLIYYSEADDLERIEQSAQRMVEGAERGKVSLLLQTWGQYFTRPGALPAQ